MSQSLLSQVLSGKRKLTLNQAIKIATAVDLSAVERKTLLGKNVLGLSRRNKRVGVDQRGKYQSPEFFLTPCDFDLHWTETAVFAMTFIKGFRPDVSWITRKLGISPEIALEALEALERKGLVRFEGDRLVRTHRKIYYSSTSSVLHVRQYCRDMMTKASAELSRTDLDACARRSINGFTLAVNSARIPEAKERLKNFLQELSDFLTEGEANDLYQLNLQLFPLGSAEN